MSEIEYKEHQSRVRKALENKRGLIVYHGLGSGKTLTAINAAERYGGAVVVTPASLRENFKKELIKAKAKGKYDVMSYEGFLSKKPNLAGKVLILDEAHRIRNSATKRSQAIRAAGKKASKVILLTGTPIQNKPHEIAPLINLIRGDSALPLSEGDFKKKYVKEEYYDPSTLEKLFKGSKPEHRVLLQNEEDFKQAVKGLVDYHMPDKSSKDFPSVKTYHVDVPLDLNQKQVYNAWSGKLNPVLRYKIKNRLPPTKKESGDLNQFLNAVRQVANTEKEFDTKSKDKAPPKVRRIVSKLKKVEGPSLIYSNYLKSGLSAMSKELERQKLPHGVYTGKLSDKKKKALVEQYNQGKLKALLVSSSGGEGLDLKGTRQVHIMEPNWHDPKIEQVIGRAARYKSHEHLDPKDRNVEVFRYNSTVPKKRGLIKWLLNKKPDQEETVDQYLVDMSSQKKALNEQFLNILREN